MNFLFENNVSNPLMAQHGVGRIFCAHETEQDDKVSDKVSNEALIETAMPHGIAAAANIMEGIEEFRQSTKDTRTMIVKNPTPSKWLDPSANFKPA